MTINVTKSHLPAKTKYDQYIQKIYESGWLTNNGQCVRELTKKLETYLGVKNLLLVTNATIGLQVAYRALGLSGEVITTPFSFVATTSSLVWEKLIPRFADINPMSFCLHPDNIEPLITQKTSAILPVHVYGNVCEVEKIRDIAHKNKLKVIYDAAHAFGVKYKGKSVLNYGDISILSFHATKLFHTVEGGALIIQDDQAFKKAQELVNFGFEVGTGEITSLGINAKMSEFHAAMGLCVLEDMATILKERERAGMCYRKYLPKNIKTLKINANADSNYAYFPIVLESEAVLLLIIAALKEQSIIPRRYFYPSLNTLPYLDYVSMPVSEDIAKRALCLPLYPELSTENITQICNIIKQVVIK